MTDLVLLRELIRNASAVGHNEDVSRVFRRCDLDCLFESIVLRGSMPYPPVAIALCFKLLQVKTIHSCSRQTSGSKFQKWYAERLSVALTIDVTQPCCTPFANAMNRVHALAVRGVNQLRIPEEGERHLQYTRPLPTVLRESMIRTRNSNSNDTHKRRVREPTRTAKSPRTSYTFHSSEPSISGGSTSCEFFAESTRSHEFSQPLSQTVDQSEDGSLMSREPTPTKLGSRNTFDETLKTEVLKLAHEFAEVSSLLESTRLSALTSEKTSILAIEALNSRSKSIATTKAIVKHIRGLLGYFFELKMESEVALAGEHSIILLHDYLESLADRGRTVPADGKHALTVWADAMGIDWPLNHVLIASAVTCESNEDVKQAPAMSLATIRKLEELASDKEVLSYKRAFSAAILVMSYASLRFADVQKIRTFEFNEDSVYGSLLSSKTRKQHGLNWPWACPRKGIIGTNEWVQPLLDMRTAFRKVNGVEMSYLFPRLDHNWQLVAEGPAPYSTTRRKLALLCVGLGDENAESYALHSPKNLLPTAANQMGFDQRELTIIGHWPSTSRMPERYDRSVCVQVSYCSETQLSTSSPRVGNRLQRTTYLQP